MINQGISISNIENPTFSQKADFLRYSKHVCNACAWLYWAGKGKPGNFLAANGKYKQLVISHEQLVRAKTTGIFPYRNYHYCHQTCLFVVSWPLMSSPPRLWLRTKLVTVDNFGLYVHAPDYDLSAFVRFDLAKCIEISVIILNPLISWSSKQSIFHRLLTDYQRSTKQISITMQWEKSLSSYRNNLAFIPALLITRTTKKTKKDVRSQSIDRTIKPSTKSSNQPCKAQPGLF